MLITDLRTLIELIKDTLPFIVCVITFIAALYFYKVALKTDRRNPFIYIFAISSVIALYFGFIDICGLDRYDYFLDGLKFFLDQFEAIVLFIVIAVITSFSVVKSIDLPILYLMITSVVSIISMFVENIDYLILKAKYICALIFELVLKTYKSITVNLGYKCLAFDNIRLLNCVYNC